MLDTAAEEDLLDIKEEVAWSQHCAHQALKASQYLLDPTLDGPDESPAPPPQYVLTADPHTAALWVRAMGPTDFANDEDFDEDFDDDDFYEDDDTDEDDNSYDKDDTPQEKEEVKPTRANTTTLGVPLKEVCCPPQGKDAEEKKADALGPYNLDNNTTNHITTEIDTGITTNNNATEHHATTRQPKVWQMWRVTRMMKLAGVMMMK